MPRGATRSVPVLREVRATDVTGRQLVLEELSGDPHGFTFFHLLFAACGAALIVALLYRLAGDVLQEFTYGYAVGSPISAPLVIASGLLAYVLLGGLYNYLQRITYRHMLDNLIEGGMLLAVLSAPQVSDTVSGGSGRRSALLELRYKGHSISQRMAFLRSQYAAVCRGCRLRPYPLLFTVALRAGWPVVIMTALIPVLLFAYSFFHSNLIVPRIAACFWLISALGLPIAFVAQSIRNDALQLALHDALTDERSRLTPLKLW
jgi:hypothetical protein